MFAKTLLSLQLISAIFLNYYSIGGHSSCNSAHIVSLALNPFVGNPDKQAQTSTYCCSHINNSSRSTANISGHSGNVHDVPTQVLGVLMYPILRSNDPCQYLLDNQSRALDHNRSSQERSFSFAPPPILSWLTVVDIRANQATGYPMLGPSSQPLEKQAAIIAAFYLAPRPASAHSYCN